MRLKDKGALIAAMLALTALTATGRVDAAVTVATQHNDNNRSGDNLAETVLTPANVNQTQFGKLFSYAVDDQVYTQPLYVPAVTMSVDNQAHNVVYIATVNDSVYAFDADSSTANGGNPLWHVNLAPAGSTVPSNANMAAMGACGGSYNDFTGKLILPLRVAQGEQHRLMFSFDSGLAGPNNAFQSAREDAALG